MSVVSEGQYAGDWLKYEDENLYSRHPITILAGSGSARALASGMVLGQITVGAATAAAFAGNTGGSGTIGAITVTAGAKPGAYRVVMIEPGTNAGRFTVEDPDGVTLPLVGTVASAYSSSGLAFTISDATDFVSGDGFTITVAAGSGKWVQMDDTASNGSQNAAGILLNSVTAPDGTDAKGVAIVRGPAIVSDNGITWNAAVAADSTKKAAAVAQLNALGIRVREGA